jgi:protein-tyrosine-phosphatase
VFHLMVVCTANQCRSPMAEHLARQLLTERGVEAEVVSRGVSAEPGIPATRGARRALARRDLDLSQHRSMPSTRADLERSDLVLAMERRHLSRLAELDLDSVHRSFTLLGLRKLADDVGPRTEYETPAEWIALADQRRDPSRVLSGSTDEDVRDPMGGSARGYRKSAALIDESLRRIFDQLFPVGS